MKKLICLFIVTIMILSMIPVMAISTSAAGEGMWTTYRNAKWYPSVDDEPDPSGEETVYPPESGYEYTADGFTVVQPDWSGTAPFVTVSTTETVNLKDGLYLEFRVDDYSYGGDINADHWICISLNTGKVEDGATEGYEAGTVTGKVSPGVTKYGGGWLTLLRGIGDGNFTSVPHLTDPKTEDFGGTFVPQGAGNLARATLDDEGREIVTFEVAWNGSEYEIKVNGVVMPMMAEATTLLEKLSANGDFFVGVTMMDNLKGGSAALTITKFGTSAADATKPVGTDSKEPEANELVEAPIADPSTIETNMPAILWSPDTVNLKSGTNCSFTVLGDNTWRCTATDANVYFSMSPKKSWSYAAEDFPVFGIMLRNFWLDSGSLRYMAGYDSDRLSEGTVPFAIDDGEFYGAEEEYVFIPVDLTDLWEGRINSVGVELFIADENAREFDVCFAGMFRSKDEAYAYANEWLSSCEGYYPETPAPATEPPYDLPASSQPPEIWDTVPEDAVTETVSSVEGESDDYEQGVEDILAKYGCAGSVGGLVLLLPLAVAVVLKKKE